GTFFPHPPEPYDPDVDLALKGILDEFKMNVARRGVSEGTRKQCRHHHEKAGIAFTVNKSYGLRRIRSPLHCLPCPIVFFISSHPI
ncbi:hypothetical protein ACJX0J_033805, partial [Zea mays]